MSLEKFIYPSLFMFLISFPLFAEIGGIENSVVNISDAIRIIFPIYPGLFLWLGSYSIRVFFFGLNVDLKLSHTGRGLYGCYICPVKQY